jgi:hypothetical protein
MNQDDYLAYLAEDKQTDVTEALRTVQCPVLVSHFQLNMVTSQDIARRIASTARDGRLLLPRDFPESLRGYDDFLDEGRGRDTRPAAEDADSEESFRIFVVARAEARPGVVDLLVRQFGGSPVSDVAGTTTSFFESAAGAVACARALAGGLGAAVGVHAGEAGSEARDHADPALVTAVLAAGLAAAGQAIVSNIIRELSAGKGANFEPLDVGLPGEEDEPMRMFTLL